MLIFPLVSFLLAHGNARWVPLISAKSETKTFVKNENGCILFTLYNCRIIVDGFKLSNDVKLGRTDTTVDPERSPMVVVIFHMEKEGSLKNM